MRHIRFLSVVLLVAGFDLAGPAAAEPVFQPAENQVAVTMVEVVRTPQNTEVRLQTQTDMQSVCWTVDGADSPYLLADGRRYHFLNGDNITSCPGRRGYAAREVMTLRFEPLGPQVGEFSLVEGQGGENQMVDPKASTRRYWNFLRVKLNTTAKTK